MEARARVKKSVPSGEEVIIIGAGLGGLALACRLAKQGKKVSIYEKNAAGGGRITQERIKGYTIDVGPTLLLMPREFEELFAYCGKKISDYVKMIRLHPHYRLHYWDHTRLDVDSDLPGMLRELTEKFQGNEQGFLYFLGHEQEVYDRIYPSFINQNPDSLRKILSPINAWNFLHADGFISAWENVERFFTDEKLLLAFSFQSMYLGQSPTHTPGTYSIIPFVELTQGVWYPTQGMQSLIDGIEKLACELGVTIHYRSRVKEIIIENNMAIGITLDNGQTIHAKKVVCNLDLPAAYTQLIPESKRKKYTNKKIAKMEYGCSSFMLFLGIDKDYPNLLHHNVFFSQDYLENFEEIFHKNKLPNEPSFYVNVPTRANPKLAPKGKHLLYVLVPVPNQKNDFIDWNKEKNAFAEKMIKTLEKRGLEKLSEHVQMMHVFTPDDWQSLAGMHFSSTFGLSPTFFQSSVFRPKQKSEEFHNLYFVGASTHPGSGMPMVLISARTCEKEILQ